MIVLELIRRFFIKSAPGLAGIVLICAGGDSHASLEAYDAAITDDATGGLQSLARLNSPLTFRGEDPVPFNFGSNSGSATMEFILEGDPQANTGSYLAVGANDRSNLRYELWFDTGQLGFTQLGVLDYTFDPGVPSPTKPAHVAYVWNAPARTMSLYLDGEPAGSREGVSGDFTMPAGQGWLGANPGGSEAMVGTIYRVTVYDGMVSPEVIRSHADSFSDVIRPPVIRSFTANPETVFTPDTVTLRWDVANATAVQLDGADVPGTSTLVVAPAATHTYTLSASNDAGTVRVEVTVRVNPLPVIHRFRAERAYVRPGESVRLSWETSFAQTFSITPAIGEVTAQTVDGAGSVEVQPAVSTTFELAASNPFGRAAATAEVRVAQPATHLVISEFMADDESVLADEDGEFAGWIEIYNPTAAPASLAGWALTDDPGNLARWVFPEIQLAPGGYLVVFASGKDRAAIGGPLHTDFRLNNDGEFLALTGPDQAIVHAYAPEFPRQRSDISYGILAGDVALVQFLGVPTPGAANNEALPPPRPVEFSHPGGTFLNPLTVILSSPDADADIWYTLDGSVPGEGAGLRYEGPIQIATTTRLRAAAVGPGGKSAGSGAAYIKLAPDLANYTSPLPIMVIENFGAGTIRRKGWNGTGAGINQVPRQAAAWATFDRVDGASKLVGRPQMLSLVGIRGRGAYSTEWRQKPYSVEAMNEEEAEVEVAPLGMPAHADWVLYFPDPDQNKDPALLFNTFAYELSGKMGRYAARVRWVEAFINENGGDLSLADRRGVYAIIEKVARGKDRLDFERLSEDGSTGGWLLNINRMDPEPETGWPAPNGATEPWFFHTAGSDRLFQTQPNTFYPDVPGDDLPQQPNAFINFDNPNGHSINLKQRAAIEGWFARFEDVLFNDAVWRDPANGYGRYLDAVDFADYFVLNVLTRNGDGLLISMYPWKGDDGKLRMGPAWDYNWSSYYVSGEPTGSLMHRSDQLWYSRLFADPDFKQLYIDRWWALRRGPLSNSSMVSIIDGQAAEITPEKALLNGMPSTQEWSRRLQEMKSWLTDRADWIDSNYIRPPVFAQQGGEVPAGFLVSMTGASGTLYVTTDGTDPRAPGGGVSTSARVYASPVPIHGQVTIRARTRSGTSWSGLAAAVFTTPQCNPDGAPNIALHPLSQAIVPGASLTLSVAVTNTAALPITYQWRCNGQDLPNGTFVLEERFCLLAITNAQPSDSRYTVHVFNAACPGGFTSAEAHLVFEPDSDSDGMPDAWETAYRLNPGAAADGVLDADQDGMSNAAEYAAGTDPADSASWLRIVALGVSEEAEPTLIFRARGARTYAVEYTDDLGARGWSTLAEICASLADREERLHDPGFRPNRFYRLVTPAGQRLNR